MELAAFPHSSPDSTTYQLCDLIYYLLSLRHSFLICKTGVSNRIPVLSELLCLWRVSCWGGLLSAGTASTHRKGTCPLLSDCTRWMSHTVPRASPAGLFSVLACLKVEFVFPFKRDAIVVQISAEFQVHCFLQNYGKISLWVLTCLVLQKTCSTLIEPFSSPGNLFLFCSEAIAFSLVFLYFWNSDSS